MANNYYSGQGSLYIATRSSAGKPLGFLPIGNVPELTLDIETTNFEHKESESGQRLVDLVIVKEKKGKFAFKVENLNLDNLALGLWGEKATVASGSVVAGTPEVVPLPQNAGGFRFSLMHPGVSSVVIKSADGLTTYTEDTDYTVDAANGVFTVVDGGAIDTATAGAGVNVNASYAYAGYSKLDAFTQANAPERWLRFEGINTVDGKRVIVDLFRAQFDPLSGYGLINEELGSAEFKGTVLADLLQTGASKFFRQINAG